MLSIAAVSDKEYLKYVLPCFKSVKANNKDVHFYLYYIGEFNELTGYDMSRITIFFDNKKLCPENNIVKKLNTIDNEFLKFFNSFEYVSEKNCYCNNARFYFIKKLLNLHINNIVFLDADNLCNKSLNFLIPYAYKYDILLESFNVDENGFYNEVGNKRYKTNFMFIKNNKNTKKLFTSIANNCSVFNNMWGHTEFFTNEIIKNNINVKELPKNFVDTNYNNTSVIWSAEGFRKQKNLIKNSTNNTKFFDKLNSIGM